MTVMWGQTSPADYDKRLAAKGHKRAGEDQGVLFYVATPTRERKPAAAPAQLPGQVDLFAALAEDGDGDGQGEEDAEPEPAATAAVRQAQRWAPFLPDGVQLSEATQGQLRQAVRDGRAYTAARRAQGFTSAGHWAAFLAYADHQAACGECGQDGPAMWLEGSASWQPASRLCPEGVRLQRISDAAGRQR